MTLLLAALVSAVVSAGVAYFYERFTFDRRLEETLAKAEIEHDREVLIALGQLIHEHRDRFWTSERDEDAKEAFAVGLAQEYRPHFRQLSNRMLRSFLEKRMFQEAMNLAYEWSDAGAHWRGDEPWFEVFNNDVQVVVEGFEDLIGGAEDPLRGIDLDKG